MLIKNFVSVLMEGSKAKGFSIFEEIVIREIKSVSRSIIRRGEQIEKLKLQSQYASRDDIVKILRSRLALKRYKDLVITPELIENSILAIESTEKKLNRYAVVLHTENKIGNSKKEVYDMLVKAIFDTLITGKKVSIPELSEPSKEIIKGGFRGEALAATRYFGKEVEVVFKAFLDIIYNNVKSQPSGMNRFPDFYVSGRKSKIPSGYKNFLGGQDNIWIEAKTGGMAQSSKKTAKDYLDQNGNFSLAKLNKDVAKTMMDLGFGYPKGTDVKALYFMRLDTNRVYFKKMKTPYIHQGKFKTGGKEIHYKAKGTRSKEEKNIYYFFNNVPYFMLSKTKAVNPTMSLTVKGENPFAQSEDASYPLSYFEGIVKPGPKKKKVENGIKKISTEVKNVQVK